MSAMEPRTTGRPDAATGRRKGRAGRMSLAILAAGLAWGTAGAAWAASCDAAAVGVINNTTTQQHNSTRDFIKNQHDQTRQDITRALMLHAGQTTASIMTEGARATEQQGQYQDRITQNDAIAQDNAYRVEQTNAMMPSRTTCQAVTGVSGLHAATTVAARSASAGNRAFAQQLDNTPGTDAADGPLPGAAQRYRNRMDKYCDPNALNSSGASPCDVSAGDRLVNADVLINETVFANPTLSADQEEAARALFNNIIEPVPAAPVRGAVLETTSGQMAHMLRTSANARLTTGRSALEQLKADRVPATSQGDWVRSTLTNLNLQTTDVGSNVSWYQLMDTLANKRYQDPYWYQALQEAQPENVQREIAQLNAIQLMVQWKTYSMLEHMIAMQASQLAVDVEANRSDFDFSGNIQRRASDRYDVPLSPPGGRLLEASLNLGARPLSHRAGGIDSSLP